MVSQRTFLVMGAAAVLIGLGASSCAALSGLDKDFHEEQAGGSGGSTFSIGGSGGGGATTTGGSGGGGGPAMCLPATYPAVSSTAPDGGDIEFVTAMRSINLDEKDFDVTLGLDLDGVCSCENDGLQSCQPIAEAVCDGPNGIDNALGKIFATVYDFSSGIISSAQLSKAAEDGKWTILTRFQGYNGTPNDANVTAMVYLTQGVAAGMPKPLWDGNDAWPVDDTSLSMPPDINSAVIVATKAYVADGVLVMLLDQQIIRIRGTLFQMDLDLSGVIVRAKITPSPNGGYDVTEGVVAAKWPLSTAFAGIASIRYGGSSKLCTTDDNYATVREAICGNADLRIVDGEGKCDTLSFGATFIAAPAKLGSVVAAAGPPSDACSPETDPTTDSCQ